MPPLITSGRFGPFSNEGEEVNANCVPELPEVITVPQSVPARPARLRLFKTQQKLHHLVAIAKSRRKCPVVKARELR